MEHLKEAQYMPSNTADDIWKLKFKFINLNSILYGLICVNWKSCVTLQGQIHSIGKIWSKIAKNLEVRQAKASKCGR